MTPKVISKAWYVWVPNMIGEYPVFSINDTETVMADTPSKAKAKRNFCESDFDSTYIDIRVKRASEFDLVEYDGQQMRRFGYENHKRAAERLENLKALPDNELYYLQDSRSYVGNSVLWWEENRSGYTTDLLRAHLFTKDDLIKMFEKGSRTTDIVWYAKHVRKQIKTHVDMQYLDATFKV